MERLFALMGSNSLSVDFDGQVPREKTIHLTSHSLRGDWGSTEQVTKISARICTPWSCCLVASCSWCWPLSTWVKKVKIKRIKFTKNKTNIEAVRSRLELLKQSNAFQFCGISLCHNWDTESWTYLSLLELPIGQLLEREVHVFSGSAMCAETKTPFRTSHGRQHFLKYGTRMDEYHVTGRPVQFPWHTVWYRTSLDKPAGECYRIAWKMTQKFEEASHPIFHCAEPFLKGDLQIRGGQGDNHHPHCFGMQ